MISIIPDNQIKKINLYWQNIFDYKPSDKDTESQTIPDNSLKNSGKISIYHINDKSFIKIDPCILSKISDFVNSHSPYKTLYSKDFEDYFKNNIRRYENAYFCYLTEPSYVSDVLNSEYSVRKLLPSDTKVLENFKKSHSEIEHKTTLIIENYPILLGCFYKDSLVSVASLDYFKNDIANLNIITHPSFRDNTIISKTLIAELCQFCLKEGKILQYNFLDKDERAKKLAQSMGFNLYVFKENLVLK
ncbi:MULTISPECIES: hypothetical protein [Clostridium]|uniref:N-acetyltransferase domain-containing protein n=1 Tax=Clostridium acetobutylicum (strain ATCC 824 / DSM 792 / JCM 1419 / IAM 19013 / LMG 5710 / NBRC 13948 / NRRL B-527 / VKM B-1787 / 2291 / W) TaxID=272562 RepID=Q97MC8_CLOAB|nr:MULTISPECIES: hypothetical protein [Clostridium]AAK78251.1 Hypothetical protein CA_C0270 [Clostridium acetobutylicum ATCC 824]ADZ19317.1 Conserved hypothetical protein [Clostridium acetobutylicum EA 2018]AEI31140.1 hypothetical protein SMB_G0275 [Clostridium acetobutylicum DSM 1731]AWV82058.1 hypothetical protein DK921_18655 [Clostridium acetobutylicum]MBC2396148.1 hypothetical protein [Clostridium acetobutylicum]